MPMNIEELKEKARILRKMVIEMSYGAGHPSHPAPALSCADIVAALYFRCMNLGDRTNAAADRDRCIISKGHACPVLYAALAELGYFPPEWLPTLRTLGFKTVKFLPRGQVKANLRRGV